MHDPDQRVRPRRWRRLVAGTVATLLAAAVLIGGPSASSAEPNASPGANPDPDLVAQWEPCLADTGVTVIVDYQSTGDGKVHVGCAPGEQSSGVAALTNAGFEVTGTQRWGTAFICRIAGFPTSATEPCVNTPAANAYWSYWNASPGDAWKYSSSGAASSRPKLGSVEGYSFSAADGTSVAPRLAPVDGGVPAPFAPATVDSADVSAVTADSAVVTASVTPGTADQIVIARYGPAEADLVDTEPQAVPAGEAPVTLSFSLTGLQPATAYSFQVRATSAAGAAATVSGGQGSFTTDPLPAQPVGEVDLAAAVAFLTDPANLVGGDHYESFPGFADVGLTIDGALALAAAGAAGEVSGDVALERIVAFVTAQAEYWTGIGTEWVAGGSIAKVALLAEVIGADPRAFGGLDLIAALNSSLCTGLTVAPDYSCAAAGGYAYSPSVFSQSLAIIALLRAGDAAGAGASIEYLRSQQNPDGGWSSQLASAGAPSEVDSSAMAAMALSLDGADASQEALDAAVAWIASTQLADGGFPGAAGDSTNSAALAVQAMRLRGPSYDGQIAWARSFLAAQQNSDGGFAVSSDLGVGDVSVLAAVGPSDVRASTQAVNGAAGIPYGALSYRLGETDPGTDPGSDPDPGGDPGTDPGAGPPTDSGAGQAADPGGDPGAQPRTDPAVDPIAVGPTNSGAQPTWLASTGADLRDPVLVGMVLLMLGGGLIATMVLRRRTERATHGASS